MNKTLQEQGYYEGATQLWLPKKAVVLKPLPKEENFFKTKAQTNTSSSRRTSKFQKNQTMQWRVKSTKLKVEDSIEVKEKILPTPTQSKTKLTREQKGKWVPKSPLLEATKEVETKLIYSSLQNQLDVEMVHQPPMKEIFSMLQTKLLGISTIFQ